jgi:hypothetical protein
MERDALPFSQDPTVFEHVNCNTATKFPASIHP